MMICHNCGVEHRNADEWCANCNQPLFEQAHTFPDSVVCLQCGARTSTTALYCDICGFLLGTPLGSPSEGDTLHESVASPMFPPKNLTDLIGETLSIYRHRLKVILVISLIAQIPTLVSTVVPWAAVLLPLSLVFTALGQGAMVHAVARRYQGHPIIVAECYGRAWRRMLSLISALFVIVILAIGIPYFLNMSNDILLVLWFPVMIFFVVRWFFFTQAVMVEGHQGFRSLIRSQELVSGNWWRVFAIGLAFLLLTVGAWAFLAIPGQFLVEVSPLLWKMLMMVGGVVTTPLGTIGATVVYFDLRVRKEGYNLERLGSEVEL